MMPHLPAAGVRGVCQGLREHGGQRRVHAVLRRSLPHLRRQLCQDGQDVQGLSSAASGGPAAAALLGGWAVT